MFASVELAPRRSVGVENQRADPLDFGFGSNFPVGGMSQTGPDVGYICMVRATGKADASIREAPGPFESKAKSLFGFSKERSLLTSEIKLGRQPEDNRAALS